MIETLATVVSCSNGLVTIEASQKTSCDQCAEPECGSGQVNKALAKRYHKLTLPYPETLAQGAQVVIAIPEQGLLTAAGLMFVLPLCCLLVSASFGHWFFVSLLQQHELWVILSSLGGGLLGFMGARYWHRRQSQNELLEPSIVRVFPCSESIPVQEQHH